MQFVCAETLPGQVINNVEFNNCIMYDFAFDSHYGVLNGAATGNFINIKFSNTTLYNIRGGIINYGSGAGCLGVVVDNCTFDRTSMDACYGLDTLLISERVIHPPDQ